MTTDSPIKFPEQRRAAVRALLVDTATSEADRRALARPPRRRAVTAVLATVAVLSGGLSIAAAAGVPIVPKAVLEVFGWQPGPGEYNPKPDTARLLLTTTGPHRQPMQLWYADASDHGYCTADIEGTNLPTSPSPGELSGRQPAGDSWRYLAAGCDGPIGGSEWREFGGKYVGAGGGVSGTFVFIMHVPGAASVRLLFPDGTSRPLPIADSWTTSWFTARFTNRQTVQQAADYPTLVGYDTHGSEIGRVSFGKILCIGCPHMP